MVGDNIAFRLHHRINAFSSAHLFMDFQNFSLLLKVFNFPVYPSRHLPLKPTTISLVKLEL